LPRRFWRSVAVTTPGSGNERFRSLINLKESQGEA
jgi:hypothetical protein